MSVASMPPEVASKATLRSPHSVCRLEKPGISIATGRSVLVARMCCSFSLVFLEALLFLTYSDASWLGRGVAGEHWWTAIRPRAGRFELGGEAEEGCFAAEAPEEVDADRQAGRVPPERHGDRRPAGDVGEDPGKRDEGPGTLADRERVGRRGLELADLQRGLRERGREPHAALAEELGDAPTHALEALDREETAGGTDASAFLPERSGVGLDVVGPRVAPDTSDPVPDDPRDRR